MGSTTSQILAESLPTSQENILHMQNFALSCISKGEYDKAIDFYEATIIKAINVFGKSHKNIAILYNDAACAYQKHTKYREALTSCRKALDIALSLEDKDFSLIQQIWKNMGSVAICQGDYTEALICYQNMLSTAKSAEGSKSVKAAEAIEEMSSAHIKQGNYAKALDLLNKALRRKVKALGDHHNSVADTLNRIGKVHQEQGEYSVAFTYYRKAFNLKKEELGNDHPEIALTHMNIASVCKDCGELDDALEHYQKALQVYTKISETKIEALCPLYCSIGLVHMERECMKEAAKWFEKATKLCTYKDGEKALVLANVYEKMANGFADKDKKEALKHLKKSLEIREKILGKEHPLVADLYQKMGSLYLNMNQVKRALELQRKALDIRQIALEENDHSLGASYWEVGSLLLDMGKSQEGKEYLVNCMKVYEKCYGREHELYQKAVEKLHLAEKKEDSTSMEDSGIYSITTTQDSIEV